MFSTDHTTTDVTDFRSYQPNADLLKDVLTKLTKNQMISYVQPEHVNISDVLLAKSLATSRDDVFDGAGRRVLVMHTYGMKTIGMLIYMIFPGQAAYQVEWLIGEPSMTKDMITYLVTAPNWKSGLPDSATLNTAFISTCTVLLNPKLKEALELNAWRLMDDTPKINPVAAALNPSMKNHNLLYAKDFVSERQIRSIFDQVRFDHGGQSDEMNNLKVEKVGLTSDLKQAEVPK